MSSRYTPWFMCALLLLNGCSQSSVSGTYLAKGNAFADLLQLTQSKDGHLIGTFSHAAMKPNGAIERTTDGVTGMVDGKSITLITNAPLSLGASMSGTVDGHAITITFGAESERFTASDTTAYQSAVGELTSRGTAIQQQQAAEQAKARQARLLSDQDANVAALNRRLSEYSTRVTAPGATKELEAIRTAHDKVCPAMAEGTDLPARKLPGRTGGLCDWPSVLPDRFFPQQVGGSPGSRSKPYQVL